MRSIFIIRHGEKPPGKPPAAGVDLTGTKDDHSLVPTGWQRAGALATLFGGPRAAFPEPTQLIAPKYATGGDAERTHETICPLSELLGIDIETPYPEKDESELATLVAADSSGVTLICWEHKRLPTIALSIPTPSGTKIPAKWPDDRFDVVWCFALDPATGQYAFSQVAQMLLAGDKDKVIKP